MAGWHPECFKAKFGSDATYSTMRSKFDKTRCKADNCLNGGFIYYQDAYVWDRSDAYNAAVKKAADKNGGYYADNIPEVEVKPEASSMKLSEAEALISRLIEAAVKKQLPNQEMQNANLRSIVSQELKKTFDPDKTITEIVEKLEHFISAELEKRRPLQIEIKNLAGEVKEAGIQHKQFPILLKAVMARVNVWMAGPSGSGKTTAAMNVANALSLPFRYTGSIGDPYALTGYNDANGKYVRTPFREAWEHGGIFLLDEVDASDPNALLAFNAALANGTAPFPDGCIAKHKDCILIAAANTWGHGADNQYVGRLKMDAAFLKRFAFLSWDYDDQMEMTTAPNPKWTKRVQDIRQRIKEKGLRVLCTPRESYIGAQLLAMGVEWDIVEQMTIRSGCTDDQWKEISKEPPFKAKSYDDYKDKFGGKVKKNNINRPLFNANAGKYEDAYGNYFASYYDAETKGQF